MTSAVFNTSTAPVVSRSKPPGWLGRFPVPLLLVARPSSHTHTYEPFTDMCFVRDLGCYPSSTWNLGFYYSTGMTGANCKASCATQGYAYSAVRSGTSESTKPNDYFPSGVGSCSPIS